MSNVFKLIKSDLIQAAYINHDINVNFLFIIKKFFISRTVKIVIFTRLSQTNNYFIKSMSSFLLRRYFIEIGDNVQIGTNLFFPHPQCIIISNGTVIGNHVHIGQYVTIGGNFRKTKMLINGMLQTRPIIGSNVMIHPGAVIGGPVCIGNDVIIGANAVVTHDVPSNTIVYGQNKFANKKISIPNKGGIFEILEEEN